MQSFCELNPEGRFSSLRHSTTFWANSVIPSWPDDMLANIGLRSVGWVFKYHEWTTEKLNMPFIHAYRVYFQYNELEENGSLSLVKRHSYLVKVVEYVPPERKDKIIWQRVFYFTWLMSLFPSCLGSEVASMLKLAFAAHFKTLRSSRCIFKDRGPDIHLSWGWR